MKQLINPDSLAAPRGFNHGILVTGGKLLFLAGQTASDASGNIVSPGDLTAQYEQALLNHKAVVEAAGGTMTDIVKMNVYVLDKNDYASKLKALGEVHRKYFGGYYPAMALFEVKSLFQDEALIELEGIAVIGDEA
jgi:enamine deaminase RidA (YjgF/YER057c/UK114 family)